MNAVIRTHHQNPTKIPQNPKIHISSFHLSLVLYIIAYNLVQNPHSKWEPAEIESVMVGMTAYCILESKVKIF